MSFRYITLGHWGSVSSKKEISVHEGDFKNDGNSVVSSSTHLRCNLYLQVSLESATSGLTPSASCNLPPMTRFER